MYLYSELSQSIRSMPDEQCCHTKRSQLAETKYILFLCTWWRYLTPLFFSIVIAIGYYLIIFFVVDLKYFCYINYIADIVDTNNRLDIMGCDEVFSMS